ncbi:MAG: GAF domain-containing protein [Anaerotruncus massiliensis (ex Togo et al. 2019)]
MGRHFDVSRAYIFENTEDGLACNNTFEWCNEGVSPQIDNLQRVPYSLIGDYAANFNEDGVFYCDDISRLTVKGLHDALAVQNIHSMLQCALKNDGVFSGYVGFDECSAQRFWTQEEIDTLTFISKILSTFLIKWRTQEKLAESFRVTRAVLDHQNLWTYVIGGDHRLLYINRKTELRPGQRSARAATRPSGETARPARNARCARWTAPAREAARWSSTTPSCPSGRAPPPPA